MTEVKGFWVGEPTTEAPDVMAVGEWTCDSCGSRYYVSPKSRPRSMSMVATCPCGTVVEITHPEPSDGGERG